MNKDVIEGGFGMIYHCRRCGKEVSEDDFYENGKLCNLCVDQEDKDFDVWSCFKGG